MRVRDTLVRTRTREKELKAFIQRTIGEPSRKTEALIQDWETCCDLSRHSVPSLKLAETFGVYLKYGLKHGVVVLALAARNCNGLRDHWK